MKDCRKTRKMIRYLEKIFDMHNIEAEIIQITDFEVIKTYPTWLLPTIVINEKVVARGYRPPKNEVLKSIK